MTIGQSLLPEFDLEMSSTRRVLERVPEDKLDWKAHEKSNSIGWVATHLAELPGWTSYTLQTSELDINPVDGPAYVSPKASTKQEILELFDRNVASGRTALESVPDETFGEVWTLLNQGEPLFSMTKAAVLRSFVMNHMIHHRGHLCVYLRLNDIPVPSLYGPSADEQ